MHHKFIKIVICLLAIVCQSTLWAYVPNDDKPRKTNTVEEAPNNNSLTYAKILLNKKLSNSLDKALFEATKGSANKDYSLLPAQPFPLVVTADAETAKEKARKMFDEIEQGNHYITQINRNSASVFCGTQNTLSKHNK